MSKNNLVLREFYVSLYQDISGKSFALIIRHFCFTIFDVLLKMKLFDAARINMMENKQFPNLTIEKMN